MFRAISTVAVGLSAALLAAGDDKPSLELRLTMKKETYPWPYANGPQEFATKLKKLLEDKESTLPEPPTIDAVLEIKNTGKSKVTIYVEGDPNLLTLTLKGPNVVTATPLLAFTTDFRLPRPVDLEAGKSFEVPLTILKDGFRRASRYLYPLEPGEYKLSANYQLATEDGGKGPVLKSAEVKFRVEGPK
ncbi:MAG: hypothetical protein NZM29_02120 [Nitrospira sp.]|nr:hypothetical protein [Nitrospira sp.]